VRSAVLSCSALLAAFALASCGGGGGDASTDSGPSAEAEVKAAVAKIVATEDPKVFCKQLVSKHLVAMVYGGDVTRCLDSDEPVPQEAGKADISSVKLDPKTERSAEVKLRVDGGTQNGATGHIEMVKEGGAWKLDDYGDDFLRSVIVVEIDVIDEGAAANPLMKKCLGAQFEDLPAAKIRELTFEDSNDKTALVNKELLKLSENCPNALADYGAEAFSEPLKGDFPPAFIKCFRKELKFGFELTNLAPKLLVPKPDDISVAALEGLASGAKQNCLKKTGG
jgi:hypothetical protein